MSADLIEFKPRMLGLQFNFNEFWRRLRNPLCPSTRVAQRFLGLFQAHGVAPVQIQRFLPQVTLEYLAADRLGAVLTNETLDQAAALFGVRREWLEGTDERLYEPRLCYKAPGWFFEDLAGWQIKPQTFAVRVLCCGDLDGASGREQPIVLVVIEQVGEIGEEAVCRYRVYHDAWDWSHPPCRLQLKAMVRLVHHGLRTPVPLHRVPRRVLEMIRAGQRVPHLELQGCLLTEPSLEDFALGADESGEAGEVEELPAVVNYIEHHQLASLAGRAFCCLLPL